MATLIEINQQYTSACAKLGDLQYKMFLFKKDEQELLTLVHELDAQAKILIEQQNKEQHEKSKSNAKRSSRPRAKVLQRK